MELRKNPELDLERRRGMFFSLGLLISLSLTLTAFQWRFEKSQIDVADTEEELDIIYDLEITPTAHPVPKRPEPVVIEQPPVFVQKPLETELTKVKIDIEPDDIPDVIETGIGEDLPVEIAPDFVDFAEYMPEPIGGMSAFYQFLSKNLKYPKYEQRTGVGGKVFIQFIVDKDGSITESKVIKGVSEGCDQEALRVFSLLPKWKPGRQGINPVKVRMIVPISFVLN